MQMDKEEKRPQYIQYVGKWCWWWASNWQENCGIKIYTFLFSYVMLDSVHICISMSNTNSFVYAICECGCNIIQGNFKCIGSFKWILSGNNIWKGKHGCCTKTFRFRWHWNAKKSSCDTGKKLQISTKHLSLMQKPRIALKVKINSLIKWVLFAFFCYTHKIYLSFIYELTMYL